jgi:hypothetical protein
MKNIFFGLIILSILSCEQKVHHFYSPDRKNCFTLIIEDIDNRVVIDGYHNDIPENNFIRFNLKEIDPIANGFSGYWNDGKYNWSLVLFNETIITENKLDTTKFKIYINYKEDEKFNPILKGLKAKQKDFFNIGTEYRFYRDSFGVIKE